MKLYTAQYKYSGDDRLDVTAKGKDPIGIIFAPTWKLVVGSKEGKISWEEYQQIYRELMQKSYQENRNIWDEILSRDEVTIVCFCESGANCHRYLLADYFEKLGAEKMGERAS